MKQFTTLLGYSTIGYTVNNTAGMKLLIKTCLQID